jgi:hypothetical protein
MQFLTTQQRKQRTRRLFLGYALVSVLVALASYIIINTALGYDLLTTNKEVVQNGLLVVESEPSNANIYINGIEESSDTGARLSLPEGTYTLELKKNGYRDWKREVRLVGGTVEQITYAKLLPIEPAREVLGVGDSAESLVSSDRRWLLKKSASTSNLWQLIDTDSSLGIPSTYSLPSSVFGSRIPVATSVVSWAESSSRVLVEVLYGNGEKQYVNADLLRPDEVRDVTSLLSGLSIEHIAFWADTNDRYVVRQSDGTIRLVLESGVRPILGAGIESASKMYPLPTNAIVYSRELPSGEIEVHYLTEQNDIVLATYPQNARPLDIDFAQRNRNEYIILAGGGLEKTLIFRNVEDVYKRSTTGRVPPFAIMPISADTAEFSTRGTFALTASADEVAVYDTEKRAIYRYGLDGGKSGVVGWLDDSRAYSVSPSGVVSVFDYEGSNFYPLLASAQGVPSLSKDGRHVFALQNSELVRIDVRSETKEPTE